MGKKHIIMIHGRATKPRREEKERLTKLALQHGLSRIGGAAEGAVESGDVKFTLAYYGDINNQMMIAYKPETKKGMVQHDGQFYEKDGCYDQSMDRLFAHDKHGKQQYEALLDESKDKRGLDNIFRLLAPIASVTRFSDNIAKNMLPDLWRYLTSREDGSRTRVRLQEPLTQAMADGDDICLVAHSMGSIVSYDVLWKISRMSEYAQYRDAKVSLWLTLGSPLGDDFTKRRLYDSNEPEDGVYPTNVIQWTNIAAHDDYVAYDGNVEDDFAEMKRRGYCKKIEDAKRIYTFWVGSTNESNPHKLYGYLDHPDVAKRIAAWIET